MSDFPRLFLRDERARGSSSGEQSGWSPWRGANGAAYLAQTGFAPLKKLAIASSAGASVATALGDGADNQNITVRNDTTAAANLALGTSGVIAGADDWLLAAGDVATLYIQPGQTHIAVRTPAGATGSVIGWLGHGTASAAGGASGGASSAAVAPITQIPIAAINAAGNTTLVPATVGKTIEIYDILLAFQSAAGVFSFYGGATLLMPAMTAPQYSGYDDRDTTAPLFVCPSDQPFVINIVSANSGCAGFVGYRLR